MEKNYWIDRWNSNDISFNQAEPHRYIKKYKGLLAQDKSDTVLFPLCGCSVDMSFILNEGYFVKGIEISDIAIEKFFSENNIKFDLIKDRYVGENIEIIKKDIFDTKRSDVGHFDFIYDRGCFVALESSRLRNKYIRWIHDNTVIGCKVLMDLFDFDQVSKVEYPPFPINNTGIDEAFGEAFDIEVLEEGSIDPKDKWKRRGMYNLIEKAVFLRRVR
jgi:thiopurine S-methyltransferase